MTPEDRKRADRAWEAMQRSHRKQTRLRVREAELEVASLKTQLERARGGVVVQEEFERGQRAFHVAMSLTHEDPGARAEHARQAAEKRDRGVDAMHRWLEERLPKAEAELEERRGELAKQLAEERADRDFAKAMQTLYGAHARAEGRSA